MSDNKIMHLSVWTAWLVLHGYLLCFRLSLGTLAVLVLAAVILMLGTWKNSKYEDGSLCNTLGNVLGASLFVQLGWYFVEKILFRITLNENWIQSFGEVCVLKMQSLLLYLFRDEKLLIPMGIAAALYVLRLCTKKWPRVSMLASYAGNGALMYPILNILYGSHVITLLYTIVTVVFIWADLWNIAVEDEWNKCGKRWFNVLTLLLLFVHSWDWYMLRPLTQAGALEACFVLGATKWYHLLASGVVAAGLFTAYVAVDPAEESVWADFRILTAAVSMLLLTAFLKWFHVGWWWILVLANVLYQLADALVIYPKTKDDEAAVILGWLAQILVGVASILAAVTGHFGTWPMLLALIAGAGAALIGIDIYGGKDSAHLRQMCITATAVAAVLIPTLVWLWMYRRLTYSFGLLLLLAAVILVLAGLLSRNVTEEDRKNILPHLAAAAIFAVLALNLTMTGGSRIEMELNERGAPVVRVEARGSENQVVSTEYRWTEDWIDLDEGTFAISKEETIPYLPRLTGREGKLRVIVTDRYGIVTETIYWLHSRPE